MISTKSNVWFAKLFQTGCSVKHCLQFYVNKMRERESFANFPWGSLNASERENFEKVQFRPPSPYNKAQRVMEQRSTLSQTTPYKYSIFIILIIYSKGNVTAW